MSDWRTLEAPAKLNLALVVGPRRGDGRHEVVTVLERLTLTDTVAVRQAHAADFCRTRRLLQESAEHAEKGRLAGAVWPKKRKSIAGVQCKRHVMNGAAIAEASAEVLRCDSSSLSAIHRGERSHSGVRRAKRDNVPHSSKLLRQ